MDENSISLMIEIGVPLLSAIISAGGVVAAAFITKLAFESIKPVFHSYSDKAHDPRIIVKKARQNIMIITALGDHLMPMIRDDLERKLRSDIQVYYMFLTPSGFLDIQEYLHGDKAKKIDVYNKQKKMLEDLCSTYGSRFQVRTFPSHLTASYIGIDLPLGPEDGPLSPNSVLHVMQYQYMVNAEDSPITFLYPKKDEEHFYSTVASMRKMWKAGEELPPDSVDTKE